MFYYAALYLSFLHLEPYGNLVFKYWRHIYEKIYVSRYLKSHWKSHPSMAIKSTVLYLIFSINKQFQGRIYYNSV